MGALIRLGTKLGCIIVEIFDFERTDRFRERRLINMQIDISPQPVVALIAGIAILVAPRLLNFIVAIYLIVFGVLGLVRM